MHLNGQTELTALTVNNIFGENQVSNSVNIQSGNTNSGSQQINITPSWGLAKVYDSTTLGGPAGAPAGRATRGLIAKCSAQNGAGTGGAIALLWEFADEIAHAEVGPGNADASNVVATIVAAGADAVAQTGLTALTVNNVYGFNQVANGLNISSSDIAVNGGISIGG